MSQITIRARSALVFAMVALAACRPAPRVAQPASTPPMTHEGMSHPGMTQASTAAMTSDSGSSTRVAADVRFMQGMIAHHAQALVMAAMIPSRTTRASMQLLGKRIDVSQHDEIRLMQQWLRAHHEDVPDPEAHMSHAGMTHPMMPGMLTDDELARLAASSGTDFDRLFLQFMIRHHEGALSMVGDLFGFAGAAQESEVYQFATDVDNDQRAEIARMQALLDALPAR